jgi:glutamyl-tRNA synthetase
MTSTEPPKTASLISLAVDPERGQALARLLFDEKLVRSPEELERLYPPRDKAPSAAVTRYAPSPTGYMHIGGVYVSLINERIARQSGGVFFLRIEDTDTLREKEGALDAIVDSYRDYGLTVDEGIFRGEDGTMQEKGAYGPYVQTKRAAIYRDYAFSLVSRGLAYPCFLKPEELAEQRTLQLAREVKPGVYGEWAKWANAPIADIQQRLAAGEAYVIRLKTSVLPPRPANWKDVVKGAMSLPPNELDSVLLKADGIPVYHFAHAVDDHLMRTTHVIRGDEWISSVPLHLALFDVLGFQRPVYAHVPPIQKLEDVTAVDEQTGETTTSRSRRKLSKRKDPEANVTFYDELGVPAGATLEYLLNIANSSFEPWRVKNPKEPYQAFPLKLNGLAAGGALSDIVKLRSVSKDVIGRLSGAEVYALGLPWAKAHDAELGALMEKYPERTVAALGIERDTPKGNKRIVTWPDLRAQLWYFYDELFDVAPTQADDLVPTPEQEQVLGELAASWSLSDSKDAWLEKVREISAAAGYAKNNAEFKQSPEKFKGHFGDLVMLMRVKLCKTKESPDLHGVLHVMGEDRVRRRLKGETATS